MRGRLGDGGQQGNAGRVVDWVGGRQKGGCAEGKVSEGVQSAFVVGGQTTYR